MAMTEDFEYRGYNISQNGANYVARAVDGEELALVSRDVERLTGAIDEMWEGLEEGQLPPWLGEPTTIDLDHPSIAKHFEEVTLDLVPPPTWKFRAAGQIIFALSVLAVATPVAVFMHFELAEVEPEIVFTLAVTAVAVLGTLPAVFLTLIVAVVYNFSHVPPIGTFTAPTRAEVVYILINLLVSIAIPMFLEWIAEVRRARARTPST